MADCSLSADTEGPDSQAGVADLRLALAPRGRQSDVLIASLCLLPDCYRAHESSAMVRSGRKDWARAEKGSARGRANRSARWTIAYTEEVAGSTPASPTRENHGFLRLFTSSILGLLVKSITPGSYPQGRDADPEDAEDIRDTREGGSLAYTEVPQVQVLPRPPALSTLLNRQLGSGSAQLLFAIHLQRARGPFRYLSAGGKSSRHGDREARPPFTALVRPHGPPLRFRQTK
jgi:hypothetical protein